MTKHMPPSLMIPDVEPYLDSLTPEEFVKELPDMIENLAMEFEAVSLQINHRNIPVMAETLRKGMLLRGFQFPPDDVPFPDRLKLTAAAGYEAISFTLSRDMAICLAKDLRRAIEDPPARGT